MPRDSAQRVEAMLRKLPEPASYERDGAAIAEVLRRYYGDEAPVVLQVVQRCIQQAPQVKRRRAARKEQADGKDLDRVD